jgi:DNA (cytosine-5)-methyltransferase 1
MRDLPEELQHPSYRRRANRRVRDGTPTDRRGGAPAGLRRLVESQPSKAITGAASRELVHPLHDRPLTLRECARLQTFPDWFRFEGNRADRAGLIGNAVPPRLARAAGAAIYAQLQTVGEPPAERGLAAFVPTLSTGMSPALAAITQRLAARYGAPAVPAQDALWV